jgi:hypothetical protein
MCSVGTPLTSYLAGEWSGKCFGGIRKAGHDAHDGVNATLSFSCPLNEVADLIANTSVSVMTSGWDIIQANKAAWVRTRSASRGEHAANGRSRVLSLVRVLCPSAGKPEERNLRVAALGKAGCKENVDPSGSSPAGAVEG